MIWLSGINKIIQLVGDKTDISSLLPFFSRGNAHTFTIIELFKQSLSSNIIYNSGPHSSALNDVSLKL